MKCLFCPDNEIECHDYDQVEYASSLGMLFGVECKLCLTEYKYYYMAHDNNARIDQYILKTYINDKTYLLHVYTTEWTANLRTVAKKLPISNPYMDTRREGLVSNICSFKMDNNQITPFNFKQKLPLLLTFS